MNTRIHVYITHNNRYEQYSTAIVDSYGIKAMIMRAVEFITNSIEQDDSRAVSKTRSQAKRRATKSVNVVDNSPQTTQVRRVTIALTCIIAPFSLSRHVYIICIQLRVL